VIEDLRENEDFKYFVQEKLLENIRDIKRYPDRWNYRCPICGDSQKNSRLKRGWYYVKSNSVYCWNSGCPASESGLPILKYLSLIMNRSISDIKFEFLKSLSKEKNNKLTYQYNKKVKQSESASKSKIDMSLKDYWIDSNSDIDKFITYRKILEAPYAPKNWKFYFDKREKRLVIPWLINNQMKCYQLRSIYKNQSPKYKFPYDIDKPVFGIDKIDESFQYVFGLEGAFDSIWVKNGVALGGINPTAKQLEELNNTLCTFVYMLDNQWVDKSSMKKTIRIASKDPNIKLFIWPKEFKCKDINEYVIKYKENPFNDENFLKKHIYNGVRALLLLNSI